MRFHTLALVAVLGYVAKKPLELARYKFRVTMRFRKTSASRDSGLQDGSYFVTIDLSKPKLSEWKIEKVENDRPLNKDSNYPELKKFEFMADGSARILVDHSRAKEYSLDIKSDNRREIEVEYNTAYGYGRATGQFSTDIDQLIIRDYGPTPHQDFATIEADIRFDPVQKL